MLTFVNIIVFLFQMIYKSNHMHKILLNYTIRYWNSSMYTFRDSPQLICRTPSKKRSVFKSKSTFTFGKTKVFIYTFVNTLSYVFAFACALLHTPSIFTCL